MNTLKGMDAQVKEPPAQAGENLVEAAPAARELSQAERVLVGDLLRQARAEGPDGLLKTLTKTVLEAALEEMIEHLGCDKHAAAGRGSGNSRNGARTNKVITDACGQVEIEVPRDRNGTFEPVIVGRRKRRVSDADRVVLSPYAKGLTTGEISAYFADVYGLSVSKDTISRITDRVIEEMATWWSGPVEKAYAGVFLAERAGGNQDALPGHPVTGSQRYRADQVDSTLKPALNALAIMLANRRPAAEER